MRLVFNHDDEIAAWMGRKLGVQIAPPYTVIGAQDRDGVLRAGFLFNDWNGSNIELTVVSERALSKGIFRALAHYVWDQLGAQRCTIRTREGNTLVLQMAERIGWAWEGVQRRYYPDGESAVILGMLRDECRWG